MLTCSRQLCCWAFADTGFHNVWAKCFTNGQLETEGAVRVAAVEQKYFDITHYISAKEIVASPDEVAKIFPAALVQQIEQKAKH